MPRAFFGAQSAFDWQDVQTGCPSGIIVKIVGLIIGENCHSRKYCEW